jgi:hypothetical protein
MRHNPFMKKNPFLSMWLSGANTVWGSARSQVMAEMHRQTNAAVTQGMNNVLAFWGIQSPKRKRSDGRRRR